MNNRFDYDSDLLGAYAREYGEKGADYIHRELREEGNVTLFPHSVLEALRNGLESVAIRLAVRAGYQNETQLTNLIFLAYHPELRGHQLRKGEPGFAVLSQEWLDIRSHLVRPVLAGYSTPTAAPSAITAMPPTEGPYRGITGVTCASGTGKCWRGDHSRAQDIVDADAPWNDPSHRSAANYNAVLDYFNVGNNPGINGSIMAPENLRYVPSSDTHCNIYVHDVTRAMWASIPHWVRNPHEPSGWSELRANQMLDWLLCPKGRQAGWFQIDPANLNALPMSLRSRIRGGNPRYSAQASYLAQQFANQGLPTVLVWRNPSAGKSGHIAMVRPESDERHGNGDNAGMFVPRSVQAGLENWTNQPANRAFSQSSWLAVRYFVHE